MGSIHVAVAFSSSMVSSLQAAAGTCRGSVTCKVVESVHPYPALGLLAEENMSPRLIHV